MKRVCLLFGGNGSEREVSICSSRAVLSSLLKLGYIVTELDFGENFISDIQKLNPDVVFNSMHGLFGEDGSVPLILDFLKIPYTHSGASASKIAFNKALTKNIAFSLGIPILKSNIYSKKQILSGEYEAFQNSFLKPCSQGSTIGCFKFSGSEGLKKEALENIKEVPDNFFLIEEYQEGIEVAIAILQNKAIGGVEIRPKSGFYDYEAKYTKGQTDYFVPPRIPKNLMDRLLSDSEKLHNTIGASCISRVDAIVKEEDYKFLEINTHPGFTATSLVPQVASHIGISFTQTIQILLENAGFKSYTK
jgi:D-alanine-D-alanine ligase